MLVTPALDSHIAHAETGSRDAPAMVFLHGNPTSSYLWRHVIPHMGDGVRTLAPDLIGMGASGKPDIPYRFADHAQYLDAWVDGLALDHTILVGHDWGGALALDWAARHPHRVRGVALMETFLRPLSWAEYPKPADELFRALRTPGTGEQMVLEENWFIETAIRASSSGITDDDLAVYRAPYPDAMSRRPLLQWSREIPLDGEPADVRDRFAAYGAWMASSPDVPKLLLTIESGGLVGPAVEQWARDTVAGLEIEGIGPARHHAPEDQPRAIGERIARWMHRHRLTEPAPSTSHTQGAHTMSDAPTFSAPLIGQTEKTLNAILDRLLAGTGLTEPQWVTLSVTVMSGGTVDYDQLTAQVAGALKVSDAEARARLAELATARLVQLHDGDASPVTLTDAGQQLFGRVRGSVTETTERLWGDLPADDLATAGRVLNTILGRANAELAAAAA
jgi:haloalkane dehalogenase